MRSAFAEAFPIDHFVRADPELVEGHQGDHAGRFEISQLLAIRPDLIDMSRVGRTASDPLGRFAQNPDAGEASAALGVEILEAQIEAIGKAVQAFDAAGRPRTSSSRWKRWLRSGCVASTPMVRRFFKHGWREFRMKYWLARRHSYPLITSSERTCREAHAAMVERARKQVSPSISADRQSASTS